MCREEGKNQTRQLVDVSGSLQSRNNCSLNSRVAAAQSFFSRQTLDDSFSLHLTPGKITSLSADPLLGITGRIGGMAGSGGGLLIAFNKQPLFGVC